MAFDRIHYRVYGGIKGREDYCGAGRNPGMTFACCCQISVESNRMIDIAHVHDNSTTVNIRKTKVYFSNGSLIAWLFHVPTHLIANLLLDLEVAHVVYLGDGTVVNPSLANLIYSLSILETFYYQIINILIDWIIALLNIRIS